VIALRARCAALALLVLLSIFSARRSALAESTLVTLTGSGSTNPSAEELLNRVRGELVADGFRVLLLDPVTDADRVEILTRAGQSAGAAIIAGLFVDDGESIELCLVDALTSRVAVQRLERPAGAMEPALEVLARRSVDLLRASLLDFVVDSLRAAVSKPKPAGTSGAPRPPVASSESRRTMRIEAEGGLGVLGSLGGVGPAALPLLRVGLAASRAVHLRVTGAWLGTDPSVTGPSGIARIDQGIAFVDASVRCCETRRVRPSISLGAGAYYVGVTGDAAPPRQGIRSASTSGAITGGLGVAFPIGSHFEAVLEAHAIVALPGIAVRLIDTDVARLGVPSLLFTATLAGWL
jgi:hypothetical protein